MTGRRPTKSAPLVSWSLRIALPSALAGFSQTAPPSLPSDRTMMSWSCGTAQPGLLELLRELLRLLLRPPAVSFSPL